MILFINDQIENLEVIIISAIFIRTLYIGARIFLKETLIIVFEKGKMDVFEYSLILNTLRTITVERNFRNLGTL